jgi:transcription elongation factor Elf1
MDWIQEDRLLRDSTCPDCGNNMRNSNMQDAGETIPVKECGHCGERWFVVGGRFCRIERTIYKTHMGV